MSYKYGYEPNKMQLLTNSAESRWKGQGTILTDRQIAQKKTLKQQNREEYKV